MSPNSICGPNCDTRYYPNSYSRTCNKCPYDCLTCKQDGTCLTCDPNDLRTYDSNTQRCIAISGYFDNLSQISLKCPNNCLSCRNMSYCTACQDLAYFYVDNLCYGTCPLRYFGSPTTKRCESCPHDCYTCSIDATCISCSSDIDFRKIDILTKRCVPLDSYF